MQVHLSVTYTADDGSQVSATTVIERTKRITNPWPRKVTPAETPAHFRARVRKRSAQIVNGLLASGAGMEIG